LNPQSPGLASPVWTFEIRKRWFNNTRHHRRVPGENDAHISRPFLDNKQIEVPPLSMRLDQEQDNNAFAHTFTSHFACKSRSTHQNMNQKEVSQFYT
jgi:hypothetical protein